MSRTYDRTTQDVGNVIALEHVNVTVPDQSQAHLFYVTGMGFTRDPYIDFGMRNMWINIGRQQFHLPVSRPQVLRGTTGIVVPSLDELQARLDNVAAMLEGSRLAWRTTNRHLEVTCPWGNRFEVHPPGHFGPMHLGMPYIRFDVPAGTAPGIVRFYRQVLDAPAEVDESSGAPTARVHIGGEQTLQFRETDAETPEYDGHHIAIYIANFSAPHRLLLERDLISEESDPSQYRFQTIVDPDSGEPLFVIEHEVRSLCHPMYGRHLINRNPSQNNRDYRRGYDAFQG